MNLGGRNTGLLFAPALHLPAALIPPGSSSGSGVHLWHLLERFPERSSVEPKTVCHRVQRHASFFIYLPKQKGTKEDAENFKIPPHFESFAEVQIISLIVE